MSTDTQVEHKEVPGRGAHFVVDLRKSIFYRLCRTLYHAIIGFWFRPVVFGKSEIPKKGPVILAPVHRSFADFSFPMFLTRRKLFFMTKDEMWKNKVLGWLLLHLGSFPVHRESADRESLKHAETVLKNGGVLVLFPEGTRQSGASLGPLLEGATFLAARCNAPIIPIGIGNSDEAMPKGKAIPKFLRIHIVAGAPIEPSPRSMGGRIQRSQIHKKTEELKESLQAVFDDARKSAGQTTTN